MALITKKTFYHEGSTYFLQLNTNDDRVRLYRNGATPVLILLFDRDLNVYDHEGEQVGTLCINDDVVHGFVDGVKVADAFDLYDAERQFSRYYLVQQSSTRKPEPVRIVELNKELGLAKLTIEQLRSRLETTEAAYMDLEAKYLALTKPKYDNHKIAGELIATALGDAYFGNALYVAKDIPGVTEGDRQVILRFLDGTNSGTDHVKLQDIANRIMKM